MNELVILGGGPAGLGLAFYANRAGIPFVLYEKSGELGGLCRTFRAGEHRYDSGAHRFHDRDPEITRDVRDLLGGDLLPVDAPSQIYDRGRFVDFPPTPLNLIASAGFTGAARIVAEIARARTRADKRVSFADFAIHQFGETIARRYLLRYSEKVWGLPAAELSPDAATRRLGGMTFGSLLLEIIARKRKVAHIDGSFFYPRLGYGEIVERLAAVLPAQQLRTRCEITAFELEDAQVRGLVLNGGEKVDIRGRMVSTLPLTLLVKLLGERLSQDAREAAAALRFRHVRLLFIRLARASVSPNASIYLPDQELCVSRVSEPKNRSRAMAPTDETSLVAEVPCFSGDALESLPAERLAERVVAELSSIGLFRKDEVLASHHHFLPNAYPVYALEYSTRVQSILSALDGISNLDVLGRSGRFFYSHLHDQLRMARDYVSRNQRVGEEQAAAL